MASEDPTPKARRPRGRPKRGTGPNVDWRTVERLLVDGEIVQDETGTEQRVYPTLRQLAARFDVSVSLISNFAAKYRCVERRQQTRSVPRVCADQQFVDSLAQDLARGVGHRDMLGIISRFLLGFEKDLREGRVRTDSASDFERLFKMQEMINDSVQQQQQGSGQLSLDAVQHRQRLLLVQQTATTTELTGALGGSADAAASADIREESGSGATR